jgi:murein L,D-transpeptidase YafK
MLMHLLLAVILLITASTVAAVEKADRVVIVKSAKTLTLFSGNRVIARYHIALGFNPVGAKQREGDGRTPEGQYVLDFKKADSAFHKAIHISYPNPQDVEHAKKLGVSPGGLIMIHGQKNHFGWAEFNTQRYNWTNGCVALTNEDMDVIWNAVDAGTAIEIRP